jgi:hypothetical protein
MKRPPTKRSAKTLLIALIAFATMIPVVANAAAGFVDVADSNVFVADIQWMADNGITQGCNPPTNDMFCPSDNVTREQMAAFMHRLATSQSVDAGTLNGLADTAFIEHGTLVTTKGGTAWQPHALAPTTFSRNVVDTTASGDGKAIMALSAPTTIGGVEYGLATVEMCIQVFGSGALVTDVFVSRQNADGSATTILTDTTDRTSTGCYTYTLDAKAGMGIGFLATTSGGAAKTVRLGSVRATWTTAAASGS